MTGSVRAKLRVCLIPAALALVASVAGVLLVSSGELQVLAMAEPEAEACPVRAPSPLTAPWAHVPAFLASIPDTKNLVTAAKGAPVPHAPGVSVRHFRGERVVAGTIELVRDEQCVGLFQNWMELVPVDASRFLLHRSWHGPDVTLVCVSVGDLRPLGAGDVMKRATGISEGDQLFSLDEGACCQVEVPRDLPPGVHPFTFPDPMRAIEEAFVMYPSTHPDSPNGTMLMRLEPSRERLTVVAPARGGFRNFDEARAPIRVFRDPATRRVVGNGLRVRPFVLTETLDAVEAWLDS